jgi:zinc D-Ala-D-Ala dipeptidase
MKRTLLTAVLAFIPFTCIADPGESLARLKTNPDYNDLSGIPGLTVDLRYATTRNFTGTNLYGRFDRAFLHKVAADKLRIAADHLQKLQPGYKLLVLDAARPRSVQQTLWDHVRGTDMQRYVANPAKGSVHNFGFAVDLTIADADGKELDMGTAYDAFVDLSQPVHEARFLREGKLTEMQIANRKLLRVVMQDAGFVQLPLEWWHFDALPVDAVRRQYKIIE